MTLVIHDGWPYKQPSLLVEGLGARPHVDASGSVCLWQPGDPARQWQTLRGWHARIAQWCASQVDGFESRDTTMDAHAYFEARVDGLARADLQAVAASLDGDSAAGRGKWRLDRGLLDLEVGAARGRHVRGRWFFRPDVGSPPRNIDEFRGLLLNDDHRRHFDDLTSRATRGGETFAALLWGTGRSPNALAIVLNAPRGILQARAMEIAPSGTEVLRSRAGSAAAWLESLDVLMFGAGAIGSHTALHLAACGLGRLTLIDGERLRPGNVVRHAAPADFVGCYKVDALARTIASHAPWTKVTECPCVVWEPDRLRELIGAHDLVIDTTGSVGFSQQMIALAETTRVPLVTAALYREGAVARVSRYGPMDTPWAERTDPVAYPTIPAGPDDDQFRLEPGCSAPVNLASPLAVATAASLAAHSALDTLAGTFVVPDEVHEVLAALETAPFNVVGRVQRV